MADGTPLYLGEELLATWVLLVPYLLALGFGLLHAFVIDFPVGKKRRFLFDRLARLFLIIGLVLHGLLLLGRLGLEQYRLRDAAWPLAVARLGRFHILSLLSCLTAVIAWRTQRRHPETPALYLPGVGLACALLAWLQLDGRIDPGAGLGSGRALELIATLTLTIGDALILGVICAEASRAFARVAGALGARARLNRDTAADTTLHEETGRGLHTGFAALLQGAFCALLLALAGHHVPALGPRGVALVLVGLALVNRLESRTLSRLCAWSAACVLATVHLDIIGI